MDARENTQARLVGELGRRGLLAPGWQETLAAGSVPATRWGCPSWRSVPAAGSPGGPEALMDATARQRRFVELAHGTPAAGDGLCAAWVEAVFSRFGFGVPAGHASELFCRWCGCSDVAELKVGMIVAVGEHPFTPDGLRFGHVGLYVGDGTVTDCVEARVRRVPLDLWLSNYGVMTDPRWGWLAGFALDRV